MLFSSASCPSCTSSRRPFQMISSNSRINWRKQVLAVVVLCLSALGEFAPSAEAQTAHFSGAVTTLSSTGTPFGVAVDRNGNVFFVDELQARVKEIVAVNGSIPASNPTINTLGVFVSPTGVAVDGVGNVFVADQSGLVQEIVAVNGTIPSNPTVNTLGSGFVSPTGVAVDGAGNVFVADLNGRVQEMVAVNGTIPASNPTINTLGSGFGNPVALAVDVAGNLFVADQGNNTVSEIMTHGVNLGSAAIGTSAPPTIPLPFTFDTTGTIGTPAVLTQGAAGLDYADAGTGTCTAGTTYSAGDTCTLIVSFTPQFSGVRYGAATLNDS